MRSETEWRLALRWATARAARKCRGRRLWRHGVPWRGDGNAGGAGADIGDLQAFAGESLFAAARRSRREAVEGDFDDVLGFGRESRRRVLLQTRGPKTPVCR